METPLFFQETTQQIFVTGTRAILEIIERTHDRARSGFYTSLVGRHIEIGKMPPRHVHTVIILSGHRRTVTHKMLDTSQNRTVGRQVVTLQTTYTGSGHFGTIIRIFARPLHDTSPTGIPTDIHHRGKRPMQPGCRSLPCGTPRPHLDSLQIETCRLSQWQREAGAKTMYHIQSEKQRNLQTGFHRRFLIFTGLCRTGHVQHGTQQTSTDIRRTAQLCIIRPRGKTSCTLAQLSNLLFQRHLLQKGRYKTVHTLIILCRTQP